MLNSCLKQQFKLNSVALSEKNFEAFFQRNAHNLILTRYNNLNALLREYLQLRT